MLPLVLGEMRLGQVADKGMRSLFAIKSKFSKLISPAFVRYAPRSSSLYQIVRDCKIRLRESTYEGFSRLISFFTVGRWNVHFYRALSVPRSRDAITYVFYSLCLCLVILSYLLAGTFANEPKKIKTEVVSTPSAVVDLTPKTKNSVVNYPPFTVQEKESIGQIVSKIDRCMQKSITSAFQEGLQNKALIKTYSDTKCMVTVAAELNKSKIAKDELRAAVHKYADVLFEVNFERVLAK